MIDKDKIILMTKMAQYEKSHMRKDKRITAYFIEDYIYVNNFKTRLWITLITLFFIAVGAIKVCFNGIIFPTSMIHFVNVYIMPYFYPWLATMIIYTFISTMVYSLKYKEANRRMRQYKRYIKQLKKYQEQSSSDEGAADEI